MKKINNQTMREHNIKSILNTVRKSGPISRVEVAKALELTSPAVSNIVSILIKDGILIESGLSDSALGRKPILLDINPSTRCVLGMVLTLESVTVVLADFSSKILHTEERLISPLSGKESIIATMIECARLCMQHCGETPPLGVGIAVPGPLDIQRGIMINPPNFSDWRNVPICDIMEKALGIPAVMDKEANAAAFAEYYFGSTEEYKTAFYILLLKNSIGGSVIRNGDILHGFEDGAGDIGHTLVDINGPLCSCGQYGCLERIASGDALLNEARSKIKAMKNMNQTVPCEAENLTIEDIFKFCEMGIPLFVEIVDRAARMIATAIGSVVSLLCPSMVVIGGPLAEMSPRFVESIRTYVKSRQYPDCVKRMKIERSVLGNEGCTKGSVMIALNAFQTMPCSQEIL